MIARITFFPFIALFFLLSFVACKKAPKTVISAWQRYDESAMLAANADHETSRLRFTLIQSKVQDKNKIWDSIRDDIADFGADDYERLYPFVYEQNIPTIQDHIEKGNLNYEELTKWYLYRIVKFENDSLTTLHTIVALNANAVENARKLDNQKIKDHHPIYGMPILLKDNINTAGMNTTAGAIALQNNVTDDATIVKNLKANGAIILGKVNLSEWAYFFCGGCPVGYSAIGGQTLNPYGRGKYETGGSSAGSGTSTAANYAIAAVGTETSGSILSPSGKNSVVGLKPTIGVLSRTGIVPISSTLDTPGPMTKSVIDNAILLSAMAGRDEDDPATLDKKREKDYYSTLNSASFAGKKLGAISRFMERDSMYKLTVEKLQNAGVEVLIYDAPDVALDGFGTLLSADMKRDLPKYLKNYGGKNLPISSVADVITFNEQDTLIRAPYGQVRLAGSVVDTTSDEALAALAISLHEIAKAYFDIPMKEHKLDAILSVDNYSAGFAAAAKYPCLTVPMGYRDNGEPTNLTFIGISESEDQLLKLGYAFEQLTASRKAPF